jgi:hypothetical protein
MGACSTRGAAALAPAVPGQEPAGIKAPAPLFVDSPRRRPRWALWAFLKGRKRKPSLKMATRSGGGVQGGVPVRGASCLLQHLPRSQLGAGEGQKSRADQGAPCCAERMRGKGGRPCQGPRHQQQQASGWVRPGVANNVRHDCATIAGQQHGRGQRCSTEISMVKRRTCARARARQVCKALLRGSAGCADPKHGAGP